MPKNEVEVYLNDKEIMINKLTEEKKQEQLEIQRKLLKKVKKDFKKGKKEYKSEKLEFGNKERGESKYERKTEDSNVEKVEKVETKKEKFLLKIM